MKKFKSILALVIVLVLSMSLFTGCGAAYSGSVDNFLEATYEGKVDKIERLAPDAYWDDLKDGLTGMTLAEVEDAYEKMYTKILEQLEDEIGEFKGISYEIINEAKIEEEKLNEIAEAISDRLDINKDEIKRGYEIDIKYTLKGADDEMVEYDLLEVIKIGSDWYVYDSSDGTFAADAIVLLAAMGGIGDMFD